MDYEVASHMFNIFCNPKHVTTLVCHNMFFNDYYTGNIIYFAGLLLSNIALIILEIRNPARSFKKNDVIIALVNGFIYALTFIVYDAFDVVLIGLWFTNSGGCDRHFAFDFKEKVFDLTVHTIFCIWLHVCRNRICNY